MKKLVIFSTLSLLANFSFAFCFDTAGQAYQIDPLLLKAIAIHESRLKSNTVLRNTNDTVDVGLMGINSVHLKDPYLIRAGFTTPNDFLDPCTNVMIGAWLLSRKVQKWGMNWTAVGSYHSETPDKNSAYQQRVSAVLRRLRKSIADGQ